MDDYERINAGEWKTPANDSHNGSSPTAGGWQVVSSGKKKHKPQPGAGQEVSLTLHRHIAPSQRALTGNRAQQREPFFEGSNIQQSRHQQEGFNPPPRHLATQIGNRNRTLPPWKGRVEAGGDKGQTRILPDFASEKDNDAQFAWRRHHPAIAEIDIPSQLVLQHRDHDRIARSNGTFLAGSESGHGDPDCKTFGIWGEPAAVAATKKALTNWIQRTVTLRTKFSKAQTFAKVHSMAPMRKDKAEQDWRKEVKKSKFRQFPPPGMSFGAIGSFHWPISEIRPEEVLGAQHEALDPIRMSCSCYIVFNKEHGIFQVSGKQTAVQNGLGSLLLVCFQISAKRMGPLRMHMLHFTDPFQVPSFVYLGEYHLPSTDTTHGQSGDRSELCPRGEGQGGLASNAVTASTEAVQSIQSAMFRKLERLRYYCANTQLRIRLGTFLVTQYQDPQGGMYELDEYEDMIHQAEFGGKITQELGHQAAEESLLSVLQKSGHLLTPQDASEDTLANVKPTYSADFVFNTETSDLRLSMTWNVEADVFNSTSTACTITAKNWNRLERSHELAASTTETHEPSSATALIDISLQDLASGLAWHFDCQAAHPVQESRIPSLLVDFMDKLKINPDTRSNTSASTNRTSSQNEISFLTLPFLPNSLRSMQQKKTYSYNLTGSDYTLELTHFQTTIYPIRRPGLPLSASSGIATSTTKPPTIQEPRWSLQISRTEWDVMFAQNGRLKVGQKVDWAADEEKWFPRDLDVREGGEGKAGFAQLVDRLVTVRELVKGVIAQVGPD